MGAKSADGDGDGGTARNSAFEAEGAGERKGAVIGVGVEVLAWCLAERACM